MIQSLSYRQLFQTIFCEIENIWDRVGIDERFRSAMKSHLPAIPATTASCSSEPWLSFSTLPLLSCEAAGGILDDALPIAAVWTLLYQAAHLVDSFSDRDIEANLDPPLLLIDLPTISTGLIASAEWILNTLSKRGIPHDIARQMAFEVNCTILKMCSGQFLDLAVPEPDLQQSWRMAEAKTGEFFALACKSGAVMTQASSAQIGSFQEFGFHFGTIVQISDDLRDLWGNVAEKSDLSAGKWSLPVAYAMSVLPKTEADELRELLRLVAVDPDAECKARKKILDCGAVIYLLLAAKKRQNLAKAALQRGCSPSSAQEHLLAILEQVGNMGIKQDVPLEDET